MHFRKYKIIYLLGFIVFILILSAYSNSLFSPFVLDDGHSFVQEPKVLNFTFSLDGLRGLVETKFGIFRFLPMLTFVLDLHWGAGNVLAFHVTNIVIHLLASLALFFMLIGLFEFLPAGYFKISEEVFLSKTLIAIFTVGLWALSPVQTNAVTYIVQRMTSIAALFYFSSLGFYLKGRTSHYHGSFKKKDIIWYILSFLAAIGSFLSKENSATLPVMIVLIEFLFVFNGSLRSFCKRYKFFVIMVVLSLSACIFFKLSSGFLHGYDHRHFTLSERLLTELRVVSSYIFLLLCPLPQFLNIEHDPLISTSIFVPMSTLLSFLFLGFIVVGAWRIRKKYPLITFCVYWFLINLLIESSIIPLELEFEHRLYLPSAGFYLLCVLLLCEISKRYLGESFFSGKYKNFFIAVIIIFMSCLSLLTYKRNITWQDSVTLYSDCVNKSPLKPRSHSNLAKALAEKEIYDEAIVECEKTLSLGVKGYEEYWVASSNLIISLYRKGDTATALKKAKILLENAPPKAKKNAYPLFLYNYGNIYLKEKNYQRAFDLYMQGFRFSLRYRLAFAKEFEKNIVLVLESCVKENIILKIGVLPKDSVCVTAAGKMVEICIALDQLGLAGKYCDALGQKEPILPEYYELKNSIDRINSLNSIQLQKGTIKTKYFYHPFASKFNFYMATAYVLMKWGRVDNLIDYLLKLADNQRRSSADVLLLKSWQLYQNKFFKSAVDKIDEAIKIDGKYAQLWINRGLYCIGEGLYLEAMHSFITALELYPGYPKKSELNEMINTAKYKLSKG